MLNAVSPRISGAPTLTVLILLIFILISLSGGTAPAMANPSVTRCENVQITVNGPQHSDAKIVCEGAEAAIGFLETLGLHPQSEIKVHLVPNLPVEHRETIGCYDRSSHTVFLLTLNECITTTGWPERFEGLDDEALYQSYVAHEIGHAVAAEHFQITTPSVTAHEYIAAVVQFGSMKSDLRSVILSRYEEQNFEGTDRINLLIYALDPAYFAVHSYRHFQKPENGPQFIHELLQGTILLQDETGL